MKTEPLKAKWEAFGWRTLVLDDGHDLDAVCAALDTALNKPDGRPTCVLAYTVSGKGVSFMEGGWEWHLGFLGPKDLQRAYQRSAGREHRMSADLSRWTPQPRAPGMSYITAEMKAPIDLSESRVGSTDDEATWDMAASLGLSRQLTTGAVLDRARAKRATTSSCAPPTSAGRRR